MRLPTLDSIVHDVRYALRTLARDARLTTFAVLIVGLGIGASVTVFSVVRALLLRALPFTDPATLIWIANGDNFDLSSRTTQVGHVWNFQANARTVADLAGYDEFDQVGDHTLLGAFEPERLTRVQVTERFFPMLGVRPLYGRVFTSEESAQNGPRAILLSHRFWERRFAADPRIVGQAITLDGTATTVIGVLPPTFDFGSMFAPGRRVDFFSAYPLSPESDRHGNELALLGRLAPGATVGAAQRELTALSDRENALERRNTFHPVVRSLREHVSGAFRPALLVLSGAVAVVMLIVAANLSNLLLARATVRERGMAIRTALGAERSRLVRQLLTESMLLAVLGAALGLVLAVVGTRLLSTSDALQLPLLDRVRVDPFALVITLGVAIATGIAFGLAPALRVSSDDARTALAQGGRAQSASRSQARTRGVFVVAEIALACVLLVGAGLLARSFVRLLDVKLGFDPEHVVALRIDPGHGFPTDAARNAYYDDALRRARDARGVQVAALTDALPMSFNRQWGVTTVGRARPNEYIEAFVRIVSDGYFRTMQIPMLEGRDFAVTDDPSAPPVVVINAALARMFWPGRSAIGRHIQPGGNRDMLVVGVVEALRYRAVDAAPGPEVYFPVRQVGDVDAVHLIARGTTSATATLAAVRGAIRPLDPTLPLTQSVTLRAMIDRSVSPRRFIVELLGSFALFALALASLGIYAVISYGVSQRRHEIGIRMALGATASMVRRSVLAQTLQLGAIGLAIGVAGAWGVARVMQGLLFDVSWSDPWTFGSVATLLILVAAMAGVVPASRAARVDPSESLRE